MSAGSEVPAPFGKTIDPGNEPAKQAKLDWIMQWLERHPNATLTAGEGKVLVDEITRLQHLLRGQITHQ